MWNQQGGYGQQSGYGDQGGGYLSSPGFGSQGQSTDRKPRNRAQNVMPCTIAQILNATQTDDLFLIDNIELHQVTIVGLVRSVKETPTRLEYEIDDMSGPVLEVKQFVDNDENTSEEDRTMPMRENTYVRVYGNVRSFQQKRSVGAFKIVPVLDMNEVTTHILEVIHSHLAAVKMQQSSGKGSGGAMDTSSAQSFNPNAYSGAQMDSMNGLTNIQKQVSMLIKSFTNEHDERGVSIQLIMENLRGIPQGAIKEAVEFLSSEGHIYSTIDDDHFKSTDV